MRSSIFWAILVSALLIGISAFSAAPAAGQRLRAPSGTFRLVAPTGTDSGDCSGSPCHTIGYAIGQAVGGDAVIVASGTYTEHITIPPGIGVIGNGWSSTTIDGHFLSNAPTVTFSGIGADPAVLGEIKVTGGGNGNPATSINGGGIQVNGKSPYIYNTWVYSNTGANGGGVYVTGGNPTFDNVPVWNNLALEGGGFYFAGGANVTVTNASNSGTNGTILFNTATGFGGGLYDSVSSATLSGVRVEYNAATGGSGGGMYISSSANPVTITLSEFSNNSASVSGDIVSGGGIAADFSTRLLIRFNSILTNTADYGAGLALNGSTGAIKSNFIINNRTRVGGSGGGISSGGTSPGLEVEGNWFERNLADGLGGGISDGSTDMVVNANVMISNTAYQGGGMDVTPDTTSVVTISNNIIAANVMTSSLGAGVSFNGGTGRIANNTFSLNSTRGIYFTAVSGMGVYNNILNANPTGLQRGDSSPYSADYNDFYSNTISRTNVAVGGHDLAVDPLFVGSGNAFNFYHLKPTSPISKTGTLAYAPPYDVDELIFLTQRRAACTSMGADQICSSSVFLPLIRR